MTTVGTLAQICTPYWMCQVGHVVIQVVHDMTRVGHIVIQVGHDVTQVGHAVIQVGHEMTEGWVTK